MKTKILTEDTLEEAVALLKNSGVVVFPTETVYGIGALVDDEVAIQRIFEIKGRPQDNPLIVHVSSKDEVYKYAKEVSETAKKLMDTFWPGPLSLIFKKTQNVSDRVSAGLDTVAIRNPSHPVARKLIQQCGKAICAPSANFSGRPSATKAQDVLEFEGKVDAIILGDHAEYGLESTVVDVSGTPTLLRPGYISLEKLREAIGEVHEAYHAEQKKRSPGMRYKHYAPSSKVVILRGDAQKIIEFIKNNTENSIFIVKDDCFNVKIDKVIVPFAPGDNYDYAARHLFDFLRDFDNKYDVMYFTELERTGVGRAIMDRLYKAAEGRILSL